MTTTAVDHLIVCVPNLGRSVSNFERRHGVSTVPGGRHQGHGTANRLVPLGDTYIELVAVIDPSEAGNSLFGTWVGERSADEAADGLALRTHDLDAVCDRLGLEAVAMTRQNSSGDELRWRIAGLEELTSRGLPFFIQWEMDPVLHPGMIPVSHPAGPLTLGTVSVSGEDSELRNWTRGSTGFTILEGLPRVTFELSNGHQV